MHSCVFRHGLRALLQFDIDSSSLAMRFASRSVGAVGKRLYFEAICRLFSIWLAWPMFSRARFHSFSAAGQRIQAASDDNCESVRRGCLVADVHITERTRLIHQGPVSVFTLTALLWWQ